VCLLLLLLLFSRRTAHESSRNDFRNLTFVRETGQIFEDFNVPEELEKELG